CIPSHGRPAHRNRPACSPLRRHVVAPSTDRSLWRLHAAETSYAQRLGFGWSSWAGASSGAGLFLACSFNRSYSWMFIGTPGAGAAFGRAASGASLQALLGMFDGLIGMPAWPTPRRRCTFRGFGSFRFIPGITIPREASAACLWREAATAARGNFMDARR